MRIQLLLLALLALSACKKEILDQTVPQAGVYVVNEGNFNFGNGDVSVYNPATRSITNGLFKLANGYAPGDVVQSMSIQDSLVYLVVNNGQKIVVAEFPSFRFIHAIAMPGASPRYFLKVNDSISYVSDLYAQKIWLLNYRTRTVVGHIPVNGWTERMMKLENTILVQQRINSLLPGSEGAILKINPSNHSIVQQITFGSQNVNDILVDKQNRVWVTLDEDTAHSQSASIRCMATDFTILKQWMFSGTNNHPFSLCANTDSLSVYFFNRHLYLLSYDDMSLPANPLIDCTGRNIYASAVNPSNGEIYLSDALDYLQRSSIERYSATGVSIHTFNAGIISCNFVFHE